MKDNAKYMREWRKTTKGARSVSNTQKRYIARFPERNRARSWIMFAFGGRTMIEAHHSDYDDFKTAFPKPKPPEEYLKKVTWLCRPCHREVEKVCIVTAETGMLRI